MARNSLVPCPIQFQSGNFLGIRNCGLFWNYLIYYGVEGSSFVLGPAVTNTHTHTLPAPEYGVHELPASVIQGACGASSQPFCSSCILSHSVSQSSCACCRRPCARVRSCPTWPQVSTAAVFPELFSIYIGGERFFYFVYEVFVELQDWPTLKKKKRSANHYS